MNTNSNSYTIIYASVMVIIVAFLLAFVSSSLKTTQDKNVQLDTKKQILAALNIKNVKDADAEYKKYVKGDMLMNLDGTLTENTGDFATNYEKEAKEQQRLHVFVCEVDGQTKYVVPVYGAGLWGAIWGYVALNSDKDTVYGVYFSHASETPGLGAEIATPKHWAQYVGKTVFEDNELVAVKLKKGGATPGSMHEVDAISGGTKTSDGVTAMLRTSIGHYLPLLEARRAAASGSNEENTEDHE